MFEDKLLVWRCKRKSKVALYTIYEKYKRDLLILALALLNDKSAAEDILHDVFVSFASNIEKFRLTGSLKGYLVTCVANKAKNFNRLKRNEDISIDNTEYEDANSKEPYKSLILNEQALLLHRAMSELPDEQKIAIMLRLHSEMRFSQIAKIQDVSINTVKSRYLYGINKLRQILNSEV